MHALVACYRDKFPGAFTNMPERYEDMPYEEIAAVLGVTLPAVKSLIFRAREELKVTLREYLS